MLVVIDSFCKSVRTVLEKMKMLNWKIYPENNLTFSKRKPSLFETDGGKGFVNKVLAELLDRNNIKIYSRYTSLRVVLAGRFNRTIRDLLQKPVFQKADGNWNDMIIRKQYKNRIHSPTKLTINEGSLKKNEWRIFFSKLTFERKKIKPKFQLNDFVRVADSKKTSSKGDTTSWSYSFQKIKESTYDTIGSYRIDDLPHR